jgi:type I restriction enzyme S subunit
MLPERQLGELCEFQRGLTYGKSDEVAVSENVVLRANNINLASNRFDFSELRYIDPSVQVPESKRVRHGAVLICTASGSKSHLGKVAYVDADYGYAFGGFMGQLVPVEGVDGRYLFHALTSPRYKSFIDELADGLNINNLKFDELRRFRVPLPGLEEQRRIVAILDEAFEGIATAKAHAERNLRNALDLLAATRRGTFAALGVEYQSTTLGLCCDFENGDRGKNYPGKEHRVVSGIPFINAGHLSEGQLDFTSMDYISKERFTLLGNGKIRAKDILFCLRGSLGKFASVGDLNMGAIASSLVILRPRTQLKTEYLLEFLASPQCAEQIDARQGGAAQPNLGAKDLKLFELPLPPREQQADVAAHLAELNGAISELRALLERKLAALDELKQSLLHQAFSGQL